MEHWIYTVIISVFALLFSVASFAWQHFRTKDAAICTLVGVNYDSKKTALFQFSISNLGTRSLLLNNFRVSTYFDPKLHGKYLDISVCKTSLPQVLKPGDIIAVVVQSSWNDDLMIEAAKYLDEKGAKGAKLYFEATPMIWNPKGKYLSASHLAAIYETAFTDNSSSFKMMVGEAFRIAS